MFTIRFQTLALLSLAMAGGCAADKASTTEPNGKSPAKLADKNAEGASDSETVDQHLEAIPESPTEPRLETITFPSEDGLPITADLYQTQAADAPFIVLFHQAGWSRGEYKEIAPKLGQLGFNCMAIDQRSGKTVNDVDNATQKAAAAKKLGTKFLDALPDMKAAMNYVKSEYPEAKRIAWGSSYSSALVLVLAGQNPGLVDASLSFSPGEYFVRFGEAKDFVAGFAAKLNIPVFITSAKKEGDNWKSIYEAIPSSDKTSFLPTTKGNHGSRALWTKHKDAGAYWKAVRAFLQPLKS